MPAGFDLDECRNVLKMTPDELRTRLDIESGEVHERVAYERLTGVTQYYNPKAFPGRVYVRGGRVEMVYVPAGALQDVTTKAIKSQLKGRSKSMRSRAGKEYTHTVYPAEGVAFSADGDEVVILEVFPPRTLDAYLKEIYEDPGPFIR